MKPPTADDEYAELLGVFAIWMVIAGFVTVTLLVFLGQFTLAVFLTAVTFGGMAASIDVIIVALSEVRR